MGYVSNRSIWWNNYLGHCLLNPFQNLNLVQKLVVTYWISISLPLVLHIVVNKSNSRQTILTLIGRIITWFKVNTRRRVS